MSKCLEDDCDQQAYTGGRCRKHYQKWLQRRKPNEIHSREYHGMSDSPEYGIWEQLKNRCSNPRNRDYPYYGGRGITVCERWRTSFLAFYQDMGARPSPELTLERVDNDAGYFPENCVWATRAQQTANRSV
jgi:hypothetical protein